MAPFDPATIARRPSRTPRPPTGPRHVPMTALRRHDFYHAPIVDPAARTISLWRLETLIGSLIGALFFPTLWLVLWLIVRLCK